MAELYIRKASRGAGYQGGDVVCVREDGHTWSIGERNNSSHEIVIKPGAAAEYEYLLQVHYQPDHAMFGIATTMIHSLYSQLPYEQAIRNKRRYGLINNTKVSKGA